MDLFTRVIIFCCHVIAVIMGQIPAKDLPLLGQTYSVTYMTDAAVNVDCASHYGRVFDVEFTKLTSNQSVPTECDVNTAAVNFHSDGVRIYIEDNMIIIFLELTINGSTRLDVTTCQETLYGILTSGNVSETLVELSASELCASASMSPRRFSVVECSYFCQLGKVFEGSRNCFRSSALKQNTWKCENYTNVRPRPDMRATYTVAYTSQQSNVSDQCAQYYSSFLLLQAIDSQTSMRELCLADGALVNVFTIGNVREFDMTLEFGIEVFISAHEWQQLNACSRKLEKGFLDGLGFSALPSTIDSFEDCEELTASATQRGNLTDCDWLCPRGVANIFGCDAPTPELIAAWGCYSLPETSDSTVKTAIEFDSSTTTSTTTTTTNEGIPLASSAVTNQLLTHCSTIGLLLVLCRILMGVVNTDLLWF